MNNQLKAKIRKEALKRFEESNRQCDAFQLGAEWMYEELMKSAVIKKDKHKDEKSFDELMGIE